MIEYLVDSLSVIIVLYHFSRHVEYVLGPRRMLGKRRKGWSHSGVVFLEGLGRTIDYRLEALWDVAGTIYYGYLGFARGEEH